MPASVERQAKNKLAAAREAVEEAGKAQAAAESEARMASPRALQVPRPSDRRSELRDTLNATEES